MFAERADNLRDCTSTRVMFRCATLMTPTSADSSSQRGAPWAVIRVPEQVRAAEFPGLPSAGVGGHRVGMARLLDPAEFNSTDTVAHARRLIGCWLVSRPPGGAEVRHRITETEAYNGPLDRACHGSRGRTARTAVLFGPPGNWYVYLCYGIHELLNLVTGPQDYPAAVLIRGIEGYSGPGRLTRSLGIGRSLYGKPAEPSSGLWLEDDGFVPPPHQVQATPRIGIDYSGPEWASKPWRFLWTK